MARRSPPAAAGEQREIADPAPERRNADETREKLLTAAAFLFNRDGFHSTDSNKIARQAGYAPGTFYKYFRDKRAVLLAVHERHAANEWDALGQAVEGTARPAELAG